MEQESFNPTQTRQRSPWDWYTQNSVHSMQARLIQKNLLIIVLLESTARHLQAWAGVYVLQHTYGKAWPTSSHTAGRAGGGGRLLSRADKSIEEPKKVFMLYPNFSCGAYGPAWTDTQTSLLLLTSHSSAGPSSNPHPQHSSTKKIPTTTGISHSLLKASSSLSSTGLGSSLISYEYLYTATCNKLQLAAASDFCF